MANTSETNSPASSSSQTSPPTVTKTPSVVTADAHSKTDPCSIHPSENPTSVFFSPVLTGDNYSAWTKWISKALNAKGKIEFIDGSLPAPTDKQELMYWKRADDLVGSCIINSIHTDIRPSCLFAESALQLWTELQLRFSQSILTKIYQLKSAIDTLKQEDLSDCLLHENQSSLDGTFIQRAFC